MTPSPLKITDMGLLGGDGLVAQLSIWQAGLPLASVPIGTHILCKGQVIMPSVISFGWGANPWGQLEKGVSGIK
jgi:hypothetical protein